MPRKRKSKRRSGCPVSVSLDLLGDRWSLLIIRDLMVRGYRTFKEFEESGEGIATNILTDRLRKLKSTGIITTQVDETDGRKVNYRLTQKGIDLAPVLLELVIWGARHENTEASCALIENMARNRDSLVTPFLWFDNQAEEAVNFYISLFKNSKVNTTKRYGDAGPGPKGSVMIVSFQLEGQDFIALNGGPSFKFTPALSLYVDCETQDEVDQLWEKLSAGGRKDRCGWLQDKYGLSWQIIPRALQQLMGDPDPKKSASVMQAMLQMDKIDIEALKRAHEKAA